MITLGVCALGDEHAAVVASAGTVIGAVSGPATADGVRVCAEEALTVAGVSPSRVDRVVSTTAAGAGLCAGSFEVVRLYDALAAQLRSACPTPGPVVIVDDSCTGAIVSSVTAEEVVRSTALRTIGRVASVLGLSPDRPVAALETIANAGSAVPIADEWRAESQRRAAPMDDEAVDTMIAAARERTHVPLDAVNTPHLPTQQLRGAIAATVLEDLASLVASAVGIDSRTGSPVIVGLAGDAFRSPAFASRVRKYLPHSVVAPLHGAAAGALGAAILPQPHVDPLRRLALGRAYSDQEIKAVLDNCRLEYLYEPDWARLLTRTSHLLSTGALIGWFQGRGDFGGVSLGSRSILCDPSSRYSRENVNVFLLGRPLHTPLHVSMASTARSVDRLRFEYVQASDLDGADKLVSAVDRSNRVLHHVPGSQEMPELTALLEAHYARTRVPGLLNVPMTTDGRLTETPRQAIRETFGSSTDALVIGRFIVAKDHWLLRR